MLPAFKSNNNWDVDFDRLCSVDDAIGYSSTVDNASKHVD